MTSKHISLMFAMTLVFLVTTAAILFNAKKPRIMILHSYSDSYSWTRDINRGLMRIFDRHPGFTYIWHYMDTKKNRDREWLRRRGLIARQAIDKWEPNILISVDNLAQELAAQHYVNDPAIDIIFAGINGSTDPYGYPEAENVTGILEQRACPALKELILSLESGKSKKSINARLRYLMDPSSSVQGDRDFVDSFPWNPLVYKGSFVAKNFTQWQKEVKESASKTDYIFVTNYRQLPRSAADPSFVPPSEVMTWTEENSPVPVIGLNPFNVEDGGMLSVGVSPYEQGEVSARMALEILEQGKSPGEIPVAVNRQFVVAMRKTAMKRRGIQLPNIYEAFCRANNTYYK